MSNTNKYQTLDTFNMNVGATYLARILIEPN